jgi:hypothetical protein
MSDLADFVTAFHPELTRIAQEFQRQIAKGRSWHDFTTEQLIRMFLRAQDDYRSGAQGVWDHPAKVAALSIYLVRRQPQGAAPIVIKADGKLR